MELTLDQALQKGVEAHKAGKVQEADRYYRALGLYVFIPPLLSTYRYPDPLNIVWS